MSASYLAGFIAGGALGWILSLYLYNPHASTLAPIARLLGSSSDYDDDNDDDNINDDVQTQTEPEVQTNKIVNDPRSDRNIIILNLSDTSIKLFFDTFSDGQNLFDVNTLAPNQRQAASSTPNTPPNGETSFPKGESEASSARD